MSKLILNNITSGFASATATNANNDAIETALTNTLSRDGTGPNQMEANLDMNGHLVLNSGNAIPISGFTWEGSWVSGTAYQIGDIVETSQSAYMCVVAHTAGVFLTDLGLARWQLFAAGGTIPAQSGNAGKVLTTDGATASWGTSVATLTTTGVLTATGGLTISGAYALRGSYGAGNVATNFAAGDGTLLVNTTGFDNVAVGYYALAANTTGSNNMAMGRNALVSNTTGVGNMAVGWNALQGNTTGGSNCAVGFDTLASTTTGINNTAIGTSSARGNTVGTYNIAIGARSLYNSSTGSYNAALGSYSLTALTTGEYNTCTGGYSGNELTTGSYNSFLGFHTGQGITTGSYNTIIGADVSGLAANLTSNIILADGLGTIYARYNGTTWTLSASTIITGTVSYTSTGDTVVSAPSISPTQSVFFVSGTNAINTIVAPVGITSGTGTITLIPTGVFTTTLAGNIALASTAVVGKALIMTYAASTGKWYPSY